MSSSIGSLNGLGGYGSMYQMDTQSMQQIQKDLFSKMDSDGSGGIDKTEFSDIAKNLSKLSGNSINGDDAFKTYDTNNDGSLSSDEMKSFMKDNAPPPPDGMGGGMSSMNAQFLQQAQDDLFSKVDGNGSGGIDKTEFTGFANKVKEHTGDSIDLEEAFSKYDTNEDGSLSSDEMKAFMKENAPSPPGQMSQATSTYGKGQEDFKMESLVDLLKNLSNSGGSSSTGDSNSINSFLSQLIENLKNGGGSSLLNVSA